jgi:AAA ATPase-like protein/effector-associated domain 1 (EAD1)-containing protein
MPVDSGDNLFVSLVEALKGAYRSEQELELLAGMGLRASLDQLTPPGTLEYRIFKLVEKYDAEAKVPELVQAVHSQRPGDARVHALFARFFPSPARAPAGAPQGPASPFDCYRLGEDTLFLDRKELRKALRAIESGSGRNVLVITGTRGSGKTFTCRLLQHGAVQHGYQIVVVNLREELLPGDGPDVLARSLLRQMGLSVNDLPAQGQASAARWTLDIVNWMVGLIRSAQLNKKWWLVIDGFERDVTPAEVRLLVTHLAAKIEPSLPNVRLGLLGYDEPPAPPLTPAKARFESLGRISQPDIEEFFAHAFQERGQPVDSGILKQVSSRVLQELPQGDPDEMRILHDLVQEALQLLFTPEVAG